MNFSAATQEFNSNFVVFTHILNFLLAISVCDCGSWAHTDSMILIGTPCSHSGTYRLWGFFPPKKGKGIFRFNSRCSYPLWCSLNSCIMVTKSSHSPQRATVSRQTGVWLYWWEWVRSDTMCSSLPTDRGNREWFTPLPAAPMPGISSTTAPRYENWDMDHLDHYQHYFYDDHDPDEDFFKSTAPSEDIWKKFELVPTPPMSPIRAVEGSGRVGQLCPSLGDKLEWVSQVLGQDDEQQQQDLPCKLTTSNDSFGNMSSIIIQDCMWSGFSAGQQLERVVGERFASCPGTGSAAKVAAASAVTSPGRAQCAPADAPVLSGLAADCVDPAAVLTFPLTGSCKKQVSSGSESHTDSSGQWPIEYVT